MDDWRSGRDEAHTSVAAPWGIADVAALVVAMQRAHDQMHRTIMLVNAERSEAVERRIVAEDSLARRERS